MRMSKRTAFIQPLIYWLVSWPLAMLVIPLYIYLPTYYHQMGLELAVVGSMLLLARISDIFTDPLVGWLCDISGRRGHYVLMLARWLYTDRSSGKLLLPSQPVLGIYDLGNMVYLGLDVNHDSLPSLSARLAPAPYQNSLHRHREGFAVSCNLVLILPFYWITARLSATV